MRLNELFHCQLNCIGTLMLGQHYVGLNSLWAPFVTVIGQFMYCLVLCCVVTLLACIPHFIFLHAKIAIDQL